MQVVSGPIGRERVHYEAPEAARLDAEMARFLYWFETATVDPVLRAGVAHFWFVTVHPFDDGNGRIARAIADLALARAEGTPQRFYSMSAWHLIFCSTPPSGQATYARWAASTSKVAPF